MTSDTFPVRCFEYHDNDQSPYNPAPIYDLDHDTGSPPSVGDYLRDSVDGVAYLVKERFFDIGPKGQITRCGLIVEASAKTFDVG